MNTLNKVITWNPLREMEQRHKIASIHSSLDGFPKQNRPWGDPQHDGRRLVSGGDISEDDHGYVLKADLPEMKKDELGVTVEDGILSVSRTQNREGDQKRKFHRIERCFGHFPTAASRLLKMLIARKVTADSTTEC